MIQSMTPPYSVTQAASQRTMGVTICARSGSSSGLMVMMRPSRAQSFIEVSQVSNSFAREQKMLEKYTED